MAIKEVKDIFKEKEMEDRNNEMHVMGRMLNKLMTNGKISFHPTTEKKLQEFINWDVKNKKEDFKRKKKFEKIGAFLAIIVFIIMLLGAAALIKLLLGYLF